MKSKKFKQMANAHKPFCLAPFWLMRQPFGPRLKTEAESGR